MLVAGQRDQCVLPHTVYLTSPEPSSWPVLTAGLWSLAPNGPLVPGSLWSATKWMCSLTQVTSPELRVQDLNTLGNEPPPYRSQ